MNTRKDIMSLAAFAGIDLGLRVLVFITALVLAFFVVMAGARTAQAASLKPVSVISSEILTLGDVFEGLSPDLASYALGTAPRPGQDMILNARTLMRIATAMDLSWRPVSVTDQVIIRREATLINGATIENALAAALRQDGLDGRFTLRFTGGQVPELTLPAQSGQDVEIVDLRIDRQNDRFSALIAAPSAAHPLAQVPVSGTIDHLMPVPVLKSTMREGEIIAAADINWIDMKVAEIQHDLILEADDMIGATPRRMATAGKPLRFNELQPPQLVSRGDTVTIMYQDGPITLSAKGKALQSGAKDELVRVVNVMSNRTIEALISGDHVVTVTP